MLDAILPEASLVNVTMLFYDYYDKQHYIIHMPIITCWNAIVLVSGITFKNICIIVSWQKLPYSD